LYQDLTIPFYGYNRPGATVSQGVRENWWRQGMMGGIKAQYDCIKAFSETDFTADLQAIDVPTLVMHGETIRLCRLVTRHPSQPHCFARRQRSSIRACRTACPPRTRLG
jgi:non-heme chloroperoxidase